jgi:hypothetical protein
MKKEVLSLRVRVASGEKLVMMLNSAGQQVLKLLALLVQKYKY